MKRFILLTILACACSTARMAPPPVVIIYNPQPVEPLGGAGLASPVGPMSSGEDIDPEFFHHFGKMPEKCKNFHEVENGRHITWCDCAGWVSNVADMCWP